MSYMYSKEQMLGQLVVLAEGSYSDNKEFEGVHGAILDVLTETEDSATYKLIVIQGNTNFSKGQLITYKANNKNINTINTLKGKYKIREEVMLDGCRYEIINRIGEVNLDAQKWPTIYYDLKSFTGERYLWKVKESNLVSENSLK